MKFDKFEPFEMEQMILNCWHVVDDVKLVSSYLMDAPLESNREDKMANMLIGIESTYQYRFEQLFSMYESLLEERKQLKKEIEFLVK